jgi:hypothetical protein
MRKLMLVSFVLSMGMLLMIAGCSSQPNADGEASFEIPELEPLVDSDYKNDPNGTLTFLNPDGQHYLIYLNRKYVKSIRSNQNSVTVDAKVLGEIERIGTMVTLAYYYVNKLPKDFADLNSPPSEALCREAPMTLASVTEKRSINLNKLDDVDINKPSDRLNNVLVQFQYRYEDPLLDTVVEVYKGNRTSPLVLARLEPNGELRSAFLVPGINVIKYHYRVGMQTMRQIRDYYFPEGDENNESYMSQYSQIIDSTQAGKIINVPKFSDCGTFRWKYENDTLGMITVENKSRFPLEIYSHRRAIGTDSGTEKSWNTVSVNGVNVAAGKEAIEGSFGIRDYSLDSGVWDFRARLPNGRDFASLERVEVENGLVYRWIIRENESEFKPAEPNPSSARYIENLIQNWTLHSNQDGVDFTVNIISHADPRGNAVIQLGNTGGAKKLTYEHSIPILIRGINVNNARSYTIKITASKEGYGPASIAINAFTLINYGKDFSPPVFDLGKATAKDFIIEGPYLSEEKE